MAAQGCCEKCANRTGICCCMNANEFQRKDLAEVVQNNERQCTDMPCLLILLCVIASQVFLIFYPTTQGANPKLLIYGYDYNGILCDKDNPNGHLTAWTWIEKNADIKICVKNCADTEIESIGKMIQTYKSFEFIGSYCIPDNNDIGNNVSNSDLTHFNNARETYERAIGDLDKTKWLILISAMVCIIIAFIYLKAIACIGRLLIYLTIIIVSIGAFFMSWLILKDGINNIKNDQTYDTGKIEIIVGSVIILIMIILILALIFMRKSIIISIEMLNEASRAVRELKQTLIFPCVYCFVGMGYILLWIVITLYIYSVKTENEYNMPQAFIDQGYTMLQYIKYEFNKSMQNSLIYHFICLYFLLHVIIYFGFMVLAGTIADWYFSLWNKKETKKVRGYNTAELSNNPILESFFRILRFHLGSLTFGAILITIVRVIRGILNYFERHSKAQSNPCVKCIFNVVSCCLKCCECILNRISKEGFIFCSIYGTAFCYSSFHSMSILLKNMGKTVMVGAVSRYVEIFGRIAISSLNTGIFIFIMMYYQYFVDNLSSVLFPSIIIFVLSLIIASHFMQVFEVAVDTIFLCYLVDETVHGQPKFASQKLTDIGSRMAHQSKHEKQENLLKPESLVQS